MLASVDRSRRHRDETAEGERDATPNLLLKHSYITLAIYVQRQMKHLKYVSETLAKKSEK
jgi:hypothetical protein